MHSTTTALLLGSAALAAAQNNVPPPPPQPLTATKSGVLPVLPPTWTGSVLTNQGAIISKAPVNSSYTGQLGPAQAQSNLPAATYTAQLPAVAYNSLTGTTISGSVTGSTTQGQTGVTFQINFANLPDIATYGPLVYHIHDQPVPADGNCTATMGHLDTQNVGEYYTCDTANPQNCQTGDLAGKHGKISATTFTANFVDNYLSTNPSSPYFFGSKSIVIHTSNTTRLTCANFQLASGGGASATPTPTPVYPGATPPPRYTGAAAQIGVTGGAFAGLLALVGFFL